MHTGDILIKSALNKKQYSEFYSLKNLRDGYGELRKCNLILKNLYKLYKVKNLKNKKILDAGFGTGIILSSLAKQSISSYGIEFVKSACERLVNINKKTSMIYCIATADIAVLPFKDETFEIIVCSHVLEHIENDIAAAMEIQRVLKKNGLILLAIPNENYLNKNISHFRSYDQHRISILFRKMKILNIIYYRSIWDNIILRSGKNMFTDILAYFLIKLTFIDDIICRVKPGKESLYILTKSTY